MLSRVCVAAAAALCLVSVVSAEPNCTTYARQDNCVGNPPLRPDPMPACGAFAGPLPANTSAFAIVGDYGIDGTCMAQVAALTLKLQEQFGRLEFILTTGDNAYWTGACASLQSGVGQYYSSFLPNATVPACTDPPLEQPEGYINPHWVDMKNFHEHEAKLRAKQTLGQDEEAESARKVVADAWARTSLGDQSPNRWFPSMGNHDWSTFGANPSIMPYFQFFPYLTKMEPADLAAGQFYVARTVIPGVELYSLNSNLGSPTASPAQQALFAKQVSWLEATVRNSTAAFKIVHFHHPPFCTAQHDSLSPWMDLDYEDWGVSAVFAGHEHVYERMLVSRAGSKTGEATTMPYVVNGLGGHPWTYAISGCPIYPGSLVRYNAFHGMQLAIHSFDEALQKEKIDFCFYSLEDGGKLIDQFALNAGGNAAKKH